MLHKQNGRQRRDDPTAITEPPAEIAERGLEGHDDALAAVHPAIGTQMLLQVQRGHGNAHASRAIARYKPRHRRRERGR